MPFADNYFLPVLNISVCALGCKGLKKIGD